MDLYYSTKSIAISLSILFFAYVGDVNSEENNWVTHYGLDIPHSLPKASLEKKEFFDDVVYKYTSLYVNLSELIKRLKTGERTPVNIIIIADTIEITDNFILTLDNRNLYLFARRIVGKGTGTVIFNANSNIGGALGVFSGDMSARINVAGLFPGKGVDVTSVAASSATSGTFIFPSKEMSELTVSSISVDGLVDIAPEFMGTHLENTFDVGASIYDQAPDLSQALLDWSETTLRALPNFRADNIFMENLYLQTANLKQFFNYSNLSAHYVPELSANLYQDTYVSYLSAMESYRTQYDRFVDRNIDIDTRQQAAQLMQANLLDAVSAEASVIQRSEQQIDSFRETLKKLENQFIEQEFITDIARVDFEIGIGKYKIQQQIELAVSVLETITGAATALASRDPSQLAEFATSIPRTAIELNSIQESIDGISDVLRRVQEMSLSVDALSSSVGGTIDQQQIAAALESLTITVPALEEANNVWEVFLVEIQNELTLAIDLGIGGASGFLTALETLIIYGKSITATEVSLIQETSRLIDLKISAEVNKRHLDRIGALIQQLGDEDADTTELESIFYRSLNALKRPMFVAVSKFSAALNYWGLTNNGIRPSLNKTYEQYRLDLAFMQEQYNDILSTFDPRPQDYNIANVTIADDALLRDFKQDGEFSLHIDLSHPDFIHFDRVRLNRVRVVLQGAALDENRSYFIDIESNGEYQDRLRGQEFVFHSNSLFRFFGYTLLDNQTNDYRVVVDGSVSDDFKFAYFEPTPFSTWSISLRHAEDFDLSLVESINLEFMGNAIPSIQ